MFSSLSNTKAVAGTFIYPNRKQRLHLTEVLSIPFSLALNNEMLLSPKRECYKDRKTTNFIPKYLTCRWPAAYHKILAMLGGNYVDIGL